jgi:hypothetical protein
MVVSLHLLRFLRGGVSYAFNQQAAPTPEALRPTFPIDAEVGTVSSDPVRWTAELVLPLPKWRGYGLDLSGGIGREGFALELFRDKRRGDVGGVPIQRNDYLVSSTPSGTFYQLALDGFVAPNVAFFLRYRHRSTIGRLSAPGEEVVDPRPGSPAGVLWVEEPHDVSFGGYSDTAWGVRLHL